MGREGAGEGENLEKFIIEFVGGGGDLNKIGTKSVADGGDLQKDIRRRVGEGGYRRNISCFSYQYFNKLKLEYACCKS